MGEPLPAFKASTTRMLSQQPLASHSHTFPPKTSPWPPYCCHMGLTALGEGPEHLKSAHCVETTGQIRSQTKSKQVFIPDRKRQ